MLKFDFVPLLLKPLVCFNLVILSYCKGRGFKLMSAWSRKRFSKKYKVAKTGIPDTDQKESSNIKKHLGLECISIYICLFTLLFIIHIGIYKSTF